MTVTFSATKKHADAVLSNGNLTTMWDGDIGYQATLATDKARGKVYFEVTVVKDYDNSNPYRVGIADNTGASGASYDWSGSQSYAYEIDFTGAGHPYYKHTGDAGTLSTGSFALDGDVIGVAFDTDAGDFWISQNGVWLKKLVGDSPDPATGTDPIWTGISTGTDWDAHVNIFSPGWDWGATINFGGSSFSYTKPVGFDSYDSADAISDNLSSVGYSGVSIN